MDATSSHRHFGCIFALVAAVLCAMADVSAAQCNLLPGSPNVAVVGRTQQGGGGIQFAWSSVQVSVVVSGTSAVSVALLDNANMYDVSVDGVTTSVLTTDARTTPYPVATSLDPSKSHVITLFKRTEPLINWGPATFLRFVLTGPSADSSGNCVIAAQSPPAKLGRVEFIGDSITSGYGVLGPFGCSFSAATESSAVSWGNLVAQALGAELHQASWSGMGMVRNYNDPSPTSAAPFPTKFGLVIPTDANSAWDFSQWVPDAVVINLGTNDYSTSPAPSAAVFQSGYDAFLSTIQTRYAANPNLQIFLACGPMIGDPACASVRAVVSAHGPNFHFIDLQNLITDPNQQCGCDWHPNAATQRTMADIALRVITPFWPHSSGKPTPAPSSSSAPSQPSPSSTASPVAGWSQGRSTYYNYIDAGNCGAGTISSTQFPFRKVAAPNSAFYASGAACGECFEVKCTSSPSLSNACFSGSVIVQVTDQCQCESNSQCCGDMTHFDLSPEAFSTIANTAAGVIYTSFRQVACPVSGNLKVQTSAGSNPWWFAVKPLNVGGSGHIDSVSIAGLPGAFQSWGVWVVQASGNGIAFPAQIQIVQGGKTITGTIGAGTPSAEWDMGTNFSS